MLRLAVVLIAGTMLAPRSVDAQSVPIERLMAEVGEAAVNAAVGTSNSISSPVFQTVDLGVNGAALGNWVIAENMRRRMPPPSLNASSITSARWTLFGGLNIIAAGTGAAYGATENPTVMTTVGTISLEGAFAAQSYYLGQRAWPTGVRVPGVRFRGRPLRLKGGPIGAAVNVASFLSGYWVGHSHRSDTATRLLAPCP